MRNLTLKDMSDKNNPPEKNLPENDEKNLEQQGEKKQPEAIQPAEHIVEETSEGK